MYSGSRTGVLEPEGVPKAHPQADDKHRTSGRSFPPLHPLQICLDRSIQLVVGHQLFVYKDVLDIFGGVQGGGNHARDPHVVLHCAKRPEVLHQLVPVPEDGLEHVQ